MTWAAGSGRALAGRGGAGVAPRGGGGGTVFDDVAVGVEEAFDEAGLDELAAVGVGAEGAGELQGGDHDGIALGDGLGVPVGELGGGAEEAGVFAGEFEAGALAVA